MARKWALIVTGLAAVACSADHHEPVVSDSAAAKSLGKNLAGESCESKPRTDGGTQAPNAIELEIVCGSAKIPVGSIAVEPLTLPLPSSESERRAFVERSARNTPAGARIAATMSCGGRDWRPLDNGEALFMACTLREGNWPQIVLLEAAGGKLFVARGIPALLAVLQAEIADHSGKGMAIADAASELKQLEDIVKQPLPVFEAADFGDYRELMRVARLYNSEQDFASAEEAERHALEIEARLFGASSPGVGETLMSLALDVSNQGKFDEAAALFRRAEIIIESAPSVSDRGRLASYRALDAANQGRYADALKFAQHASALRRSVVTAGLDQSTDINAAPASSSDNGEVVHSLMIEAAMALRLDDLPSAEAAASDALKILSDTPGLPLWWRAEALMLMGDINARESRFAAAEREYRDALAFRQKLFGETAPAALAHIALGRLYAQQEIYAPAIQQFQSALDILARDKAARAELVPEQIAPFIGAAAVLSAKDPARRPELDADVFRASQMLDSGVAVQTAAKASVRLGVADPVLAALVRDAQEAERKRDSARIELADETAKPDAERNLAREARIATDAKTAGTAADEFMRQLQDKYPDFARRLEPGAVTLGETSAALRSGEALLSFVISREQSYALLEQPDQLTIRPIGINEEALAADVAELRQALEPKGQMPTAYDLHAAFSLYKKLLGPLADRLSGTKHLIVVARGPLASLPLSLLVEHLPATGSEHDYANASWLVRHFAITQVASVRAFVAIRTAARPVLAGKSFLGLGDPAFVGAHSTTGPGGKGRVSALDRLASECRDNGPVPAQLLRDLAPLPETATEVKTIARLLGAESGAVLLGANATEEALRNQPLERFRVLYFATHGLLPGELHCQTEPALALSPPAQPVRSRSEDGLLEASEIAGLKLDAELVVLSACNTAASGGRFGGDALSGLAEAFFYAGARTVLASHWPVPSVATARLMTVVFERLGPNLSRGVAQSLREAQLYMLEKSETSHPFFWAAFSVIGDGAPRAPQGSIAEASSSR